MKKILFVAFLGVFAACGDNKTDNTADSTNAPKADTTISTPPAADTTKKDTAKMVAPDTTKKADNKETKTEKKEEKSK